MKRADREMRREPCETKFCSQKVDDGLLASHVPGVLLYVFVKETWPSRHRRFPRKNGFNFSITKTGNAFLGGEEGVRSEVASKGSSMLEIPC